MLTGPQTIDTLEDLNFQLKVTNNGGERIFLLRDPSGVLSTRHRTEKFTVGTPDGRNVLPHFKGIKKEWSHKKAAELDNVIVIDPGQTTYDVIEQDYEYRFENQSIMYQHSGSI
ncbi:hypothetical protein AX14_003728 [Amanita brunnescens Koide BX004]|nr:hypothetical protein AX14_003728 [Amanita brunnescens Koide BX004]